MSATHPTPYRHHVLALRILCWIAIVASLLPHFTILFHEEPMVLPTKDGVHVGSTSDVAMADRAVLIPVFGLSSIIWIMGLCIVLRIAKRMAAGDVLSTANYRSLARFSTCLILMGLVDFVTGPIGLSYLKARGYVESIDFGKVFPLADSLDLILAGVFLWLLARIFLHSVSLEEEAKLTV